MLTSYVYLFAIFASLLVTIQNVSGQDKEYGLSISVKVNWFMANQMCNMYNMDLATIRNANQARLLMNFIRNSADVPDDSSFWLGGSSLAIQNNWVWASNGRPFTYTNWMEGTPCKNPALQNFCIKQNYDGTWMDVKCNERRYFVCESRDDAMLCN